MSCTGTFFLVSLPVISLLFAGNRALNHQLSRRPVNTSGVMWWFSTHLYFSYFCFISKINPGYKILKNCFVSSQFHLLQIRTSKKPASKVHNLFFCVLLVQIICQSRLRQISIVRVLLLSNFLYSTIATSYRASTVPTPPTPQTRFIFEGRWYLCLKIVCLSLHNFLEEKNFRS